MKCVYGLAQRFLLEWQPCQINIMLSVSVCSFISPQKSNMPRSYFMLLARTSLESLSYKLNFNECSWNIFPRRKRLNKRLCLNEAMYNLNTWEISFLTIKQWERKAQEMHIIFPQICIQGHHMSMSNVLSPHGFITLPLRTFSSHNIYCPFALFIQWCHVERNK